MSSLWKAVVTDNKRNLSEKLNKPSPSILKRNLCLARDIFPPLKHILCGISSQYDKNLGPAIKRTSLFIFRGVCRKKLPAGMTVEAAAVLPLLLFFFLNLTCAIEMIRLHCNLELALWESGRQLASYGYLKQMGGEMDEHVLDAWGFQDLAGVAVPNLLVRSEVIRYVGREYLDQSPLTFGAAGLNFWEADFLDEEDGVDLTLTYQVSPLFQFPGFSSFRMGNRYYIRAWTGYELSEETNKGDEFVYVTEYGTVYHESLECSYLKLSVRSVTLAEAYVLRNSSGEEYTLCWICRDEKMPGIVYITADGSRYHYSSACPALKRIIHTLRRSEAGKYRPCSRCAS